VEITIVKTGLRPSALVSIREGGYSLLKSSRDPPPKKWQALILLGTETISYRGDRKDIGLSIPGRFWRDKFPTLERTA